MVSTRRAAAAAGEKPLTTFATPPDVRRAPRKRKLTDAPTPAPALNADAAARNSPAATSTTPNAVKTFSGRVADARPLFGSDNTENKEVSVSPMLAPEDESESTPRNKSKLEAERDEHDGKHDHQVRKTGLLSMVATPIRRLFSPFRAFRATPATTAAVPTDPSLLPPSAVTPSLRRLRPMEDDKHDAPPATEPPRKRQRMAGSPQPRKSPQPPNTQQPRPRTDRFNQNQGPEGFRIPVYTAGRKMKIRTEWEEELKKQDMRERGVCAPETEYEAKRRENRKYHYEMLQRKFPATTRYRARPEYSRWGVPAVFPGSKEDKNPWLPEFKEIRERDFHITSDHHRRDKILRGSSHQEEDKSDAPEAEPVKENGGGEAMEITTETKVGTGKKRRASDAERAPDTAKRAKQAPPSHVPTTSSPLARTPLKQAPLPKSPLAAYPTPKVTNMEGSFAVPDSPISSSSEDDEPDIPTPTKPMAEPAAVARSGFEAEVAEFTDTIASARLQALVHQYMIGRATEETISRQLEEYADLLQEPTETETGEKRKSQDGSLSSYLAAQGGRSDLAQLAMKATQGTGEEALKPLADALEGKNLKSFLETQGARPELAHLAMKAVEGLEGEDMDPLADMLEDPALF